MDIPLVISRIAPGNGYGFTTGSGLSTDYDALVWYLDNPDPKPTLQQVETAWAEIQAEGAMEITRNGNVFSASGLPGTHFDWNISQSGKVLVGGTDPLNGGVASVTLNAPAGIYTLEIKAPVYPYPSGSITFEV